MSRNTKGNAPVYRQPALFPQMEPPPKKLKNPPKTDPHVQARLDNFVADDEWVHVYDLYYQKALTKKQAANAVNIGSIEFDEQIKLYKTNLRLQKYETDMQARLKAFVAYPEWTIMYLLCKYEGFPKNEASYILGVPLIEFKEQIRLFNEYQNRKGRLI